ncbi:MAG: DHH family phosphoesterase [Candidatus Micrarchaeota archaeon]
MNRKMIDYLEEAHEELSNNADGILPKPERLPLDLPDPMGGVSPSDALAFMEFAGREGKRTLDTFKDVLVVNHFDSDGLSSGAIVALALKARGIPFRIMTIKKMSKEVLDQVQSDSSKCVIFSDAGTGFLNQINGIAKSGKSILQIDHHLPEEIDKKSDALSIINPHFFNIDGSFHLCSASGAYFTFSKSAPIEAAKRMAQLGIVGAVGDVQDLRGLTGLNHLMLEEAKKLRVVDASSDLRLFGRVSRGLVSFLAFCSEPFLPGLTGNSKACALFLKKNGIPLFREENGMRKWLRYYDLPRAERIKLIGALMYFCYEKRITEDVIKSMLGEVYLFPHERRETELYDAYEFSSLLNACGRSGKPDVGIRLCMNEPGAYEEAHALLAQHRMGIAKSIAIAKKNTEDLGAFYFLDARGEIPDSIIGTVAGSYFNSGLIERGKPIIALSIDETGQVKGSSRAWRGLIDKGLDLGALMSVASKEAGGFGGGHSIAAGASFPNTDEALKKFLLSAKKTIKQQIGV